MKQRPAGRASSSEKIIRDIRRKTRKQYSAERPHDSLGRIPPAMFRRQVDNADVGNIRVMQVDRDECRTES